jgi:serine/threonine-protein kinase HipA
MCAPLASAWRAARAAAHDLRMNATYQPTDALHLWWLADPGAPRHVGTLRLVRRAGTQPGGVSLEYTPEWIAAGQALSEDLPLRPGEFMPTEANAAAGAVDDARPDRWGERVIRLIDRPARLSTLEYLYFAGDNRFGALGVSLSADAYLPRRFGPLPVLADVQTVSDLVRQVEAGESVEEPLRRLVTPGATLGGARPKALVNLDGQEWVLKFGDAGDPLDSPLIEHATMTLAARAGIEVCETQALRVADGHAVAIRRFDRAGAVRLHALSAHVALRASGQSYGYPELALLLRRRADAAVFAAQGAQLFRRMVFNILIDNTDDHEKNHALLVDERQQYRLAPAYDVLPSGQALGYQQMRIGKNGADSTLDNALSECRSFALTLAQAMQICREVVAAIGSWRAHFAATGVSVRDIELLAEQIDRPFLFDQRIAQR